MMNQNKAEDFLTASPDESIAQMREAEEVIEVAPWFGVTGLSIMRPRYRNHDFYITSITSMCDPG